jgi:hypothetical protein
VPQYFFHLHEGGSVLEDEEGRSLPDDAAARDAAVQSARGILAAAVLEGRLPLSDMIVVTDHLGQTVARTSFSTAAGLASA